MKDNGGTAFPGQRNKVDGYWNQTWDPGMALRDYFAAAALTGILSNRAASMGPIDPSEFAHDAYVVADDMLAERNKP